MKKFAWTLGILGAIILLGGLLTYGLGLNKILPVPRPDLIVWGTNIVGIILITAAFSFITNGDKQLQIEEKDERNIAIRKDAGATAFWFLICFWWIAFFVLIFMGYMNDVSCFTMLGVYSASLLVYMFRVEYLQRKM
jgi:hypothetical protein